jgi:hypothetical protein
MSFIRRLMGVDTINTLLSIGVSQQELIERQRREIERLRLEHLRQVRDLIEQFWLAQEAGLDVREQLHAGLQDMRDHVARLEEHAS